MKREKLFDAITDIRDHLIVGAEKRRKRKVRWIAPVAAAAAVVLVLTALLNPAGNPTGFLLAEAAYPEIPPRPEYDQYQTFEEFDTDNTAWMEQYGHYYRYLPEEITLSLRGFFKESIRSLMAQGEGKNRACSPLNLYMALGLLSEITDGTTREEILKVLNAADTDTLRTQVNTVWNAMYHGNGSKCIPANALWLNEGLSYKSSALDTLSKQYYTSVYQGKMGDGDYDRTMQNWVNTQTGNLLKEQVSGLSMPEDTVMALTSTLYFSSKWNEEFDEEYTKKQTFHAVSGDVECDFLNESYTQKGFYWGERFTATFKSFKEGQMLFLLPDQGVSADELLRDEQALSFLAGDRYVAEAKTLDVSTSLPKFDVVSQMELTEQLRSMGINEVFTADANFSPLTNGSAVLSEVQHGTRVYIDEEGCEAASYIMMEGAGDAMPEEVDRILFLVNRPFIFAVYNEGIPLYVGVVHQP